MFSGYYRSISRSQCRDLSGIPRLGSRNRARNLPKGAVGYDPHSSRLVKPFVLPLSTHPQFFVCISEKLQAIASPWAEWISDLENRHVAAENGLSQVLQWDTKRGRDFQCIAQFVYCCSGLPEKLFPTAQRMEKWLIRVDSPPPLFKTTINEVLTDFWHMATDSKLKYGFTTIDKRLAPIEFVFVGANHFFDRVSLLSVCLTRDN